ncbi:MAG: hypothetical protein U5L10_02140 [Candidatus Moranbacteria bacterium]|nr:hypothetical protein [Candidatus Moranbacteria bacterium]
MRGKEIPTFKKYKKEFLQPLRSGKQFLEGWGLGKPQWFPHYQKGPKAKKQKISGRSGSEAPGIFCFFAEGTTAFYIKQCLKPANFKGIAAFRFSFAGFYLEICKDFSFLERSGEKENFLQITFGG